MTAKEETLARWPNAQAKQIPHALDFPLWVVDLTPQFTEDSTIVGDGKTEDEVWAQAADVARSANAIVGPRPSSPNHSISHHEK